MHSRTWTNCTSPGDVIYPSDDKALKCLLDKQNHDLFPDDRLVVFFEPYKIMRENIEYILRTSTVQTTFDKTSGKCEAVSFLSVKHPKRGLRLDIEVYTDDRGNGLILQHIIRALNWIADSYSNYDGPVIMWIFTPLKSTESVRNVVDKMIFRPGPESKYTHYVTVERTMPTSKM